MRAQAIGDGIVVADTAAKAQHIGPAGSLLLGGSRVLRQCGTRGGKQDQEGENSSHRSCSTECGRWRQLPMRLLSFIAGAYPGTGRARGRSL
jgi:hypothetical protein